MILMDEKEKRLADIWRTAGSILSVRIEAPYTLQGADGTEAHCVAFLPDFGSPRACT